MNPLPDIRYAVRLIRRAPLVSAIIVLTLALCMGANTAIFSVVDATLLRPLPYPEPDRLVLVATHFRGHEAEGDVGSQDGRTWGAIRDRASLSHEPRRHLSCLPAITWLSTEPSMQLLRSELQPPSAWRRSPGGPAITVLSYHLWRQVFNADPSAVGRSVIMRGEPYTIVGVMPERFQSDAAADLWTPLRPSTTGEGEGTNYAVIGRLKPGVTWEQADAQIEAVGAPLIQEMKLPPDVSRRLRLVTLQRGQTEDVRKPVLIVWAAVGLVLLIGCANVTSLLLARAATRTREIATRRALGGGRGAIIRQFLMESLVLAAAGGAAGLLLGYAGIEGLSRLAQDQFPAVAAIRLDGRVLAMTALLALGTSVLAGIFPALEASGVDIRSSLTEGGARAIAGTRKRWSRRLLVSGEIALAVLLLIGAGLLVRTLAHLYRLRPGFDPANVIVRVRARAYSGTPWSGLGRRWSEASL